MDNTRLYHEIILDLIALVSTGGEGIVGFAWQASYLEDFLLQSTLQYVANPGVADGELIGGTFVFGLRMQASW